MTVMPEPIFTDGVFSFREDPHQWVLRHIGDDHTAEVFEDHIVYSSADSEDEWHVATSGSEVHFFSGDIRQMSAINVDMEWVIDAHGNWVPAPAQKTSVVSMMVGDKHQSCIRWDNGDSLSQTIGDDIATRTLTRAGQRSSTKRLWSGPVEVSSTHIIFDRVVVATRDDNGWVWVNPVRKSAWMRLLHAAFPDRPTDEHGVPHV